MIKEIFSILLICSFISNSLQDSNDTNCEEDMKVVADYLCFPQGYLASTPPEELPKLPKLTFLFQDVDIIGIDLQKQGLITSFDYSVSWFDNRIKFPENLKGNKENAIIATDFMKKFWIPPMKIHRVIDADSFSVLGDVNVFLVSQKYSPNTTMYYYSALKVETACEMDFEYFPFDEQNCQIMVNF